MRTVAALTPCFASSGSVARPPDAAQQFERRRCLAPSFASAGGCAVRSSTTCVVLNDSRSPVRAAGGIASASASPGPDA